MITESRLREIAGSGNVGGTPWAVETYAGDMSFVGRVAPRFVVKVDTAEVIQALVRAAKETVTPLVPVSSGPPHFHGDTVPASGDAIVLDMSGMKKIDWISRSERVAVFEPGVTFGELIPAVAKEGLRLNMPLRPRSAKSVIGSMLSREPVILPRYHWDVGDPLGSTEVIFGTGDMFRTGAAAGPGSIEEQRRAGGAQKEAAGPSNNSWHRVIQGSQGTMGLVTWASARCEVLPQLEEPLFVGSSELPKLLEAAHWLVRLRLAHECLLLNDSDLAALSAETPAAYARLKAKLPPWVLFYNLAASGYLPEEGMQGQLLDARDLMQRIGLPSAKSVGGIAAEHFLEEVRQPSTEPYWKLRPTGACQDIFLVTTYAKLPGLVQVVRQAVEGAGFPSAKTGIYLQPMVQGTSCHCEFSLFYDPEDKTETAAARTLATSLINPLTAAGAFFSRPFGEAAGEIMNRDAASVALLKKVKAILDPVGILNPGKLCF
jgi:FAD/FMN-containing dehydrogenase